MCNHLFTEDSRMKNFIKAFIFITIFIIIVCVLNRVFSPVGSSEGGWYVAGAMRDMYKQEKNTIDVLYVGNSNVYTGVSPLEIYDNIGITGYSASTPQQDMIGSFYIVKEFFKIQKPKVVMLDVGEIFTIREHFTELGMRSEIDYMKSGLHKIDILNDECMNFSLSEKASYLFPIVRYHSRYDRLTEFDIRKLVQKSEISYKGYLYENKTEKYKNRSKNNYNEYKKYEEEHNQSDILNIDLKIPNYINEKIDLLIQLCKENESELVLMMMPITDERAIEKSEFIKEYAKEKGVKYVDFNMEKEDPINWETDTQDKGEHLNIKGAEKVGNYVSKFLKENFEIESKKDKKEYDSWNKCLEAYNERKKQNNV